jgi:hypothetical protein
MHIINDRQNRNARFIGVLSFFFLLHVAATAKHFSFHYLLPALCLFNSIFPLFYINQKSQFRILKPLAVVFILIFICVYAFYCAPYYKKLMDLTQDIRNFNDKINANYPECAIIPSTTIDIGIALNKQQAMLSANGATFRLEGDDLLRLYPHSYYFFSEEVTSPDPNVESYGIWNFKQRVFGDDIIAAYPCAIFIKYVSDFSDYPYQVRLLDRSKYLNAFLLISSTEKQANDLFLQAMDSYKRGDYQKAFLLGLKSRQLNYEPRHQLEYYLMIFYHDLLKSRGVE